MTHHSDIYASTTEQPSEVNPVSASAEDHSLSPEGTSAMYKYSPAKVQTSIKKVCTRLDLVYRDYIYIGVRSDSDM